MTIADVGGGGGRPGLDGGGRRWMIVIITIAPVAILAQGPPAVFPTHPLLHRRGVVGAAQTLPAVRWMYSGPCALSIKRDSTNSTAAVAVLAPCLVVGWVAADAKAVVVYLQSK